ncbi:ArsR/SmtB family transcription factor [Fuchsiella alkaliacetigena]|uniref:ArsR/SmtB family transcription factor n=1 Tax=Fuchsiella alkaliacetigena TaxID=957042 RepID=UPI00200B00FC|nr:metalloregulator ArsR/SmtB family transcription factor [Fuchsiella alkaliacetigena]MCK8824936.1 metalloregulator ArsR/SmtB family transcription factor [Fuchsiella alkaliacetigena]
MDLNLNDELIELFAEFFKKVAEGNRLRILLAINQEAKSVSEIIDSTELSQPLVSFHLRVLREANIIQSQREGTFVYYSLVDSKLVDELLVMLKHLEYFESEDIKIDFDLPFCTERR